MATSTDLPVPDDTLMVAVMAMNRVVVRYHEVALKGGNRTTLVAGLTRNIMRALEGTGVDHAHRAPGRIILHLPSPEVWPQVRERLKHVFGIANFLLCERSRGSLEQVTERITERVGNLEFDSFAVRTKRCDKTFPIPSPEVSAAIGASVQARTGRPVSLSAPELEIHVEILPKELLYSLEKVAGAGGMPTASGGTVLVLLSGGIDSPVAAHRMMRRGCYCELVHFHGAPFQGRASAEKAEELARILSLWQPDSRLHLVSFGEIQRAIVARAPKRARVVLYRRMMARIAERLAAQIGAGALCTGDSLGQVASQTLPNLATVDESIGLPILRPLIAMDKEEITAQARAIGTYETSILPEEDCCSLFVPKHPSTSMTIGAARAAEADLDIGGLLERSRDHIEVLDTVPPAVTTLAAAPG